jgi:peptidoglycan/xylan/chitin deacetylase (PgdA/CDA1 family)
LESFLDDRHDCVTLRVSIALAASLLAASATGQPKNARLQIAVTIDDLPVHAPYPPGVTPDQVSQEMIAALKADHVPVTGFVNAVRMQETPGTDAVLDRWHAAGATLGNHGWAHRHLSEMSVADFEQELVRDEPPLAARGAGTDWRWFRYPFVDEGKDAEQRAAARKVLLSHGYRVAAVTTGFSDWAFTPAYARCIGAKNTTGVAELERMYLDSVRQSITQTRENARKLYGRDIPYVLLMHVSAMSAHMMPQVIRTYRQAGFHFVSVAEAERDPVYRGYTDLRLPAPASDWEVAKQKGVKLAAPPDYSARLNTICT